MKTILLFLFILTASFTKAQKIDSIYVNLYTDSLKKGTYNYINVDGLLSNGKYIPLDSNHIIFHSSCGKFYGNDLWIDSNTHDIPVNICIKLKKDPSVQKNFVLHIKKKEDEPLKSPEELMNEMQQQPRKKRRSY